MVGWGKRSSPCGMNARGEGVKKRCGRESRSVLEIFVSGLLLYGCLPLPKLKRFLFSDGGDGTEASAEVKAHGKHRHSGR